MLLNTANVLPKEEKWNFQPKGVWGVQKNSVPYYPEKSIFQTSSGPKHSGKSRVDCTSKVAEMGQNLLAVLSSSQLSESLSGLTATLMYCCS